MITILNLLSIHTISTQTQVVVLLWCLCLPTLINFIIAKPNKEI